jgi:hypothetical protein
VNCDAPLKKGPVRSKIRTTKLAARALEVSQEYVREACCCFDREVDASG